MKHVETFCVTRFTEKGPEELEASVVKEDPFTIMFNNQELVTLLCSPIELKYLAVGFLASEGLLTTKADIKKLLIDERRGIVRVETNGKQEFAEDQFSKRFITSGCGRGATFYNAADVQGQIKIESETTIAVSDVLALTKEFLQHSETYKTTGGVHSAALCDSAHIAFFAEDIGRHNAIDKLFGRCLLEDIPTKGQIIISSGRISSEMLLKVAKRDIPIIISKSAPTALGVKLAEEIGITLIGFVRGKKMNVYAHAGRISKS